jgi:ABC-type multidrug transport system fused ATPase/permease subunit
MRNIDILYNYIIDSLTSIFEFLLILLFIYLIKENMLSISMALALYSYKSNVMINFMSKVSELLEEINNFNLSADRVFEILDKNKFKKEKFGSIHLDKVNGDFEFKNVIFGYEKETPILNNLSFKINANETVGLVGKSGAGKSTIFNLLCKMYDIKEGTITIDGVNINDLEEDSIRGNITIISQNPYIFNMSIKDNLKLVKSDVTDEEIVEACRLAYLDDFIETLPNQYDTIVGEGGIALSGGQKQRLAIARAFIQKTEIILFDEATSALDNETQSKIQESINNLKKDYTVIIIAHRLSTIVNCDKIMILEDGKIIESGTHQELLSKNKMYQELCKTELIKENKKTLN